VELDRAPPPDVSEPRTGSASSPVDGVMGPLPRGERRSSGAVRLAAPGSGRRILRACWTASAKLVPAGSGWCLMQGRGAPRQARAGAERCQDMRLLGKGRSPRGGQIEPASPAACSAARRCRRSLPVAQPLPAPRRAGLSQATGRIAPIRRRRDRSRCPPWCSRRRRSRSPRRGRSRGGSPRGRAPRGGAPAPSIRPRSARRRRATDAPPRRRRRAPGARRRGAREEGGRASGPESRIPRYFPLSGATISSAKRSTRSKSRPWITT
jgi:hypothetical protein